jgi:hypothetical protein
VSSMNTRRHIICDFFPRCQGDALYLCHSVSIAIQAGEVYTVIIVK